MKITEGKNTSSWKSENENDVDEIEVDDKLALSGLKLDEIDAFILWIETSFPRALE